MVDYRVSKKNLVKGQKIEMEHTTNPRIARRIARDHLREHPTYYEVLPYAERIMAARERKKAYPIRTTNTRMPARQSSFP